MTLSRSHPVNGPACGDLAMQEALSAYVDGELAGAEQPRLFTHLAACPECRRTLDGIMGFRRIVREENLAVPPAVDDAFFKRLRDHQQVTDPAPRAPDRRPSWRAPVPVSLRLAVTLAVVVFLVGLFTPVNVSSDDVPLAWVEVREELVDVARPEVEPTSAVYVFYPGLTVEASRQADDPIPPSL